MDSIFDLYISIFSQKSLIAYIIVFVFGALIGSFLNVCAYRLPLGRSIVEPPSACATCGSHIAWYNNLPVLSYFLLHGRCASCFSKYSIRYSIVEFLNGFLYLILFHFLPLRSFLFYAIFLSVSIVIFLIDYDHWLILDSITLPAIVFGILFYSFVGNFVYSESFLSIFFISTPTLPPHVMNLIDASSGALGSYILFRAISFWGALIFRQEAMGAGDATYAAVIGAFLGFDGAMIAFTLAFFIACIVTIPYLFKKQFKKPIPFGTFMAFAAFLTIFFKIPILDYLFYGVPW